MLQLERSSGRARGGRAGGRACRRRYGRRSRARGLHDGHPCPRHRWRSWRRRRRTAIAARPRPAWPIPAWARWPGRAARRRGRRSACRPAGSAQRPDQRRRSCPNPSGPRPAGRDPHAPPPGRQPEPEWVRHSRARRARLPGLAEDWKRSSCSRGWARSREATGRIEGFRGEAQRLRPAQPLPHGPSPCSGGGPIQQRRRFGFNCFCRPVGGAERWRRSRRVGPTIRRAGRKSVLPWPGCDQACALSACAAAISALSIALARL